MSKDVTLHQKTSSGTYDTLYPKSASNIVALSEETSEAYSLENGTVEDAINSLKELLSTQRKVLLRIVDTAQNPVENATVNGLSGSPHTDSNGVVSGVVETNTVTIVPPSNFVDLKGMTIDISNAIGELKVTTIVLPPVRNNTIVRFTSSTTIKFTAATKSIDVCCVAGGGGGAGGVVSYSSTNIGGGGGGGGIINVYNIPIAANETHNIIVGAGGITRSSSSVEGGGDGGSTSFDTYSISGGKGGLLGAGGEAGLEGCGNGGYNSDGESNTTITEFDNGYTYYSGGGGGAKNAASSTTDSSYVGGSPNGAYGAIITKNRGIQAGTARTGGGGGGGGNVVSPPSSYSRADSSAGGNGLVAIRIHNDY